MRKSDYIKLVFSFFKQSKVRTIICTLVMFLLILLGNIFINFEYNINHYIEKGINTDINGRILLVHKYDNEKNEMYDYDRLEEELNKYEHIDYLYNVKNVFLNTTWNDNDLKINIALLPIKYNVDINIINGKHISSDNEIICPMYLNPSGNNKIDNMISLKEYLNKDITLNYRQIEAKNEKEIVVTNVFNDKFKLTGLYQNVFSSTMDNICYIDYDKLKEISSKAKEIYGTDFDVSDNSTSTNVVVDKLENVDKVYQRLLNDGYLVHKSIEIDYTPIKMFKYISYILLVIILFILLLVINMYIKNIISNRKYDIGLYKAFGYKNKIITYIFEILIIILILIAYILSLIVLIIGIKIGNNILSNYISLSFIDIKLSYRIELIYLLIMMIIIIINTKFISKKICSMEVRSILNVND